MAEISLLYKIIDGKKLRYGFTTGACAASAAKAAFIKLYGSKDLKHGDRPLKTVNIDLAHINNVEMKIDKTEVYEGAAYAEVIKFAGDDPDVTNGARIGCMLKEVKANNGDVDAFATKAEAIIDDNLNGLEDDELFIFKAGEGVGSITKPGLSLEVGEPAINPMPRRMIINNIKKAALELGIKIKPLEIFISCIDGKQIAKKTMNEALGIIGGISILGTTGIVIPYSDAAWIVSIAQHVKVLAFENKNNADIIMATGKQSFDIIKSRKFIDMPDKLATTQIVEIGNYFAISIKNANKFNFKKLIICSGFAKICKFALGADDTHSQKSSFDAAEVIGLIERQDELKGRVNFELDEIISLLSNSKTASEALQIAQSYNIELARIIAKQALVRMAEIAPNISNYEVMISARINGKLKAIAHEQA